MAEPEQETYEQELAAYLQERIKPGLNRGAIPLLVRSIAKEIAHRERPNGASEDAEGEHAAEVEVQHDAEVEDEAEAEDQDDAEAEDQDSPEGETPDFEADMHELQADLGEDWILRFSVHNDDAWLTAEKEDGSQHIEAPTASVLYEVVERLNEADGRST